MDMSFIKKVIKMKMNTGGTCVKNTEDNSEDRAPAEEVGGIQCRRISKN